MQAYDPYRAAAPPPPQTPPQVDYSADRILSYQQEAKPWFISIFENLKELAALKRQPPLQVSFRPMTAEELKDSDEPALRQLAVFNEEKSFFKSLSENLGELFHPQKLPPLQLTSRPLTEEELAATMSMGAIEQTALPWYRTVFSGLRDALFPPKLPPLELTSRPVQVRELFQKDPYRGGSFATSVLLQVGLIALLFAIGSNKAVQNKLKENGLIFTPVDLAPYSPANTKPSGGGGGGDNSPLPASKGRLPKASLKQFTPPEAVLNNLHPRLAVEPTIIAPPDVALPNVNMAQYGDPFAKIGPPSNGPGSGGGIGSGSGGGVGSGRGPGVGPGEGGGFGGGAFRIGGGVSAPIPIYKPEPEYSEEARKAKFQGTVMLAIVVDTDGKAKNIQVVRSLGMGLDEKAVEAVAKWRFKPGYKDGRPVPVKANVEVNFRLL
ncbi:MAG TPA: energy transducer TonB [Isosphaeraceae bacterium]|nr:energy transducer TonB [Isosphaeraceae bacterium]